MVRELTKSRETNPLKAINQKLIYNKSEECFEYMENIIENSFQSEIVDYFEDCISISVICHSIHIYEQLFTSEALKINAWNSDDIDVIVCAAILITISTLEDN